MLDSKDLENALIQYHTAKFRNQKIYYLGFMSACLVQFGILENNGDLSKNVKKVKIKGFFKTYEDDETFEQVIIRLSKEYLKKN